MRYIYIAIMVLYPASQIMAEDLPSMEDFMVSSHEQNFCDKREYINCMGISRDSCSQSFRHAFRLCIKQKAPDSPTPSPLCITTKYINFIGAKDSTIKSCEHITAEIADSAKKKYMPNPSLNTDAQ